MSPLPPDALPLIKDAIPLTFRWPVKFCLYTTAGTYFLSLLTGNVSQVDRLWTFLPVIYTAYYALLPFWPAESPLPLFPNSPEGLERSLVNEGNPRTWLMLALQVIWMCRLSYNTWRRGLFSFKDEDYRWEVLRQKLPTWLFQVVNFTFIAIIQNILLFLLAVPTHNAAIISPPSARSLQTSDYVLAVLSLITLATEFTADNQQFAYQTHKRSVVPVYNAKEWPGANIKFTQEDDQRGFITHGLWAWSRHPNFACEQLFWILQAFFPICATGKLTKLLSTETTPLVNIIPPLALCMLFLSSTMFSESISKSKYPAAYAAYQNRVAMFWPLLTPVHGLILQLLGKKDYYDRMVYGQGDHGDVKKIE